MALVPPPEAVPAAVLARLRPVPGPDDPANAAELRAQLLARAQELVESAEAAAGASSSGGGADAEVESMSYVPDDGDDDDDVKEEEEAVVQPGLPARYRSEVVLQRFLVGKAFDVEAAAQQIRADVAWRAREDAVGAFESAAGPLAAFRTRHPAFDRLRRYWPSGYHGWDGHGAPVYFERMGLVEPAAAMAAVDLATLVRFHVYIMECAARLRDRQLAAQAGLMAPLPGAPVPLPHGGGASGDDDDDGKVAVVDRGLTYVMDVAELSFGRHFYLPGVQLATRIITTDETHYPEILRTLLVVNAPPVFGKIFAALQPFLHARTLAKIKIIPGGPETYLPAIGAAILGLDPTVPENTSHDAIQRAHAASSLAAAPGRDDDDDDDDAAAAAAGSGSGSGGGARGGGHKVLFPAFLFGPDPAASGPALDEALPACLSLHRLSRAGGCCPPQCLKPLGRGGAFDDRHEDGTTDSPLEVRVAASTVYRHVVVVDRPGPSPPSTLQLAWEFRTEANDIGFSVWRLPAGYCELRDPHALHDPNIPLPEGSEEIVPAERRECDKTPASGSFDIDLAAHAAAAPALHTPLAFVLVWDNSYSMLRAKVVTLAVVLR